jgi:hypothetical protein
MGDDKSIYKEAIAKHQDDIDAIGKVLVMSAVSVAISETIDHPKGVLENSENFEHAKMLLHRVGTQIGMDILETVGKK